MKKRRVRTSKETLALRRRVRQLEYEENERRGNWSNSYPGGVHLATIDAQAEITAVVRTARRLSHAVVVIEQEEGEKKRLLFYGLPLPKEEPHA